MSKVDRPCSATFLEDIFFCPVSVLFPFYVTTTDNEAVIAAHPKPGLASFPLSTPIHPDHRSSFRLTTTPHPRGNACACSAGGAEGLLARRKAKEALASETPWEASLRKERERKRARKKAIKERIEAEEAKEAAGGHDDDDDDDDEDGGGEVGGGVRL